MTTISQLEVVGGKKIGVHGGRTKRIRFAKKIIMIGFIIVAAVVLTLFLSRSGLYIEIIQREREWGHYRQYQ